MALQLVTIAYRSPRRIRLFFDQTLDTGAFSTAPYVVTNQDSLGVDPNVVGAFIVPNSPHVVELALSDDMVSGALYRVTCTAVPDTEPATFTGFLEYRALTIADAPSPSVAVDDLSRALYGTDLLRNAFYDVVEDANGDLATIAGLPNVQSALERAVTANGLPWAPKYGAGARASVDAPSVTLPSLRGNITRACVADDRVKRVVSQVTFDDNTGKPELDTQVELIGNHQFQLLSDPTASSS